MNANPLLFALGGIFLVMWGFSILGGGRNLSNPNNASGGGTTVVIAGEEAAAGLDLEVLPTLIAQSDSAEAFEKALNTPEGPNNLDLNDDGKVDFIKVTEFSNEAAEGNTNASHGFSLTVDVTETEEQEVAVIEINRTGEKADVVVSGNQQIYGNGAHYRSSHSLGTFFMMAYLLSPHRSFFSPYGYGAYPSYYNSPGVASYNNYNNRANNYKRAGTTRVAQGTSLKSPNANKQATSIKRSLRSPNATQKAFQSRQPSKRVGTGGFGRNTKSASQRGFGGRLARNFATSQRSFGGSFGK